MVFSSKLDKLLVPRRALNANTCTATNAVRCKCGARRANFAKKVKIRVVRLISVLRVERFLVLEKAVSKAPIGIVEGFAGNYNEMKGAFL
jgi:hypothetical protein